MNKNLLSVPLKGTWSILPDKVVGSLHNTVELNDNELGYGGCKFTS